MKKPMKFVKHVHHCPEGPNYCQLCLNITINSIININEECNRKIYCKINF